jgi:hypothetical protein
MRAAGLSVFVSYSHRDESSLRKLEAHLSPLRRSGLISIWHDRRIEAGATWESEIDEQMRQADLVLLLVSADFLNSDYCYEVELETALRRHALGKCVVVPIIVSDCDWGLTPFSALQALPKDGRPISSWRRRDQALADVARGLRLVIQSIRTRAVHGEESAPVRSAPHDLPAVVTRSLGSPTTIVGDRFVTEEDWASHRARELFILMLSRDAGGVTKEEAVEALYPTLSPEKCNSAFHSNVYRIRRALYQDAVVKRQGGYALNPDGSFEWDVGGLFTMADSVREGRPVRLPAARLLTARYDQPFEPQLTSPWADELRQRISNALNLIVPLAES